jgi:hypothetical protein
VRRTGAAIDEKVMRRRRVDDRRQPETWRDPDAGGTAGQSYRR